MEFLMFIIVWLGLCGAAAAIASSKGRSGMEIFFLSFFSESPSRFYCRHCDGAEAADSKGRQDRCLL